jgi:hypothetical protein
MNQILRELGRLVFNFNSAEHATGSEGQVFILALGRACGARPEAGFRTYASFSSNPAQTEWPHRFAVFFPLREP